MSRNLGRTCCGFCSGSVTLEEQPRAITRDEAGCYYETHHGFGYARGIFANARCGTCGAKYLAWVSLLACDGYSGSSGSSWGHAETVPFFDLSFRRAFNDEPAEEDLPDWEIIEELLSEDLCKKLECFAGTITRRIPWPRCERTGRKIWRCYGCPCSGH